MSTGTEVKTDCIHYWLIEPPNGLTSHGICRNCKEEGDFPNISEEMDTDWHKSMRAGQRTGIIARQAKIKAKKKKA
jgi:hypothetical protein